MTIKSYEFDKLVGKFGLKTRESGDKLAWLEYDGKIVVRTRRSHKKGDLPMQNSIRKQLKLNENQLRDAIGCTLSFEQYIEILRTKGLL